MKKLHIAQIVPSLLATGPVRAALDFSEILREMGHNVVMYYFDEKPGAKEVPNSQKISFFQNLDFSKFDVVHTHGLRPDAYRYFKIKHSNTVTTLQNYAKIDLSYAYGKTIAAIFTPLWRKFVSRHRIRVVLSADMQQYYEKEGWVSPFVVIPNSRHIPKNLPNKTLQQQISAFANGRAVLGNISHNNPRKGLRQVLLALKELPSCCFVHIGTGQETLQEEAKKLGVSAQCLCIPARTDAAEQLPLFDIFVLPSYSEGFPLALLEALAAKVPAVTSAIPVYAESFPETVLKTFELDNIPHLITTLKEVLTDTNTWGNIGHEWYLKQYTPQIIANKFLDVYTTTKP
ncbi:MAG: glycosyltransferase [Schleiferiaceae bacterium]|nr:glycosyltransferase [Schleiferiaceae bacterium]